MDELQLKVQLQADEAGQVGDLKERLDAKMGELG